ncbi:hypothetical protein [Fusobacterium ulcerans]|nr:hypothetical protein [Fusobacterium ulcerans]
MGEKEIMQKVSEVAEILKGCNHFEKEKIVKMVTTLIEEKDEII